MEEVAAKVAARDGEISKTPSSPDSAAAEARFRALFNSPFHYTALLAPDGVLLDVNRRALAEGGLPRESILGVSFWELSWWGTSEQVQSRVRAAIARAALGELVREDEDVCEEEDALFVVELLLMPVRDADGRVVYLVAEAQDVTWRAQAQSALRLSEERFRTAMHSSPIGLALVAPDGHFLEVNPALCRIVGYTEDELKARDFQSITHPDDLDIDVGYMRAVLRREIDTYEMEKRYFHKDGRVVWILLSVAMVSHDDGSVRHFISQIQDITERKRIEEGLRQSEELYRTAMHSAAIGAALIGLDGRFLEVNEALCRIVGYTEDELLATHSMSLTHPADLEGDLNNARLLFSGEVEGVSHREKRFIHRDGHEVWVSVHAAMARGSDGVPTHFTSQFEDICERKRVEARLQESEERFRTAMRSSAAGMAIVSLDGRLVEVNAALCRIFGYSEAELLALDPRALTFSEVADENPAVSKALVDGEIDVHECEKLYRHADGHAIWGLRMVSLVRDGDGTPRYFVAQVHDITERKQVEAALRESEARFRSITERSAVGTALVAPDKSVLAVNPAFCNMCGYREEELKGRDFQFFTHPDDVEEELVYVEAMIRREIDSFQMEKRYIRKDGRVVWVLLGTSVVSGDDGVPRYAIGQVQDITGRKQAELALRASQERFRAAMHSAAIGMALVTADGRFREVNDALCRLVGYTREELLARDANSITHPDDIEPEMAYVRVIASGEIKTYQMEKRYIHKDGHAVWIMLNVARIEDGDGSAAYAVCHMQDITDRKNAEAALRISEERFKSAIRFSTIGMALVAPDGRHREVNSEFCRIVGFSEEELCATDFQSLTHPDDLAAEMVSVQAMLRREIDTYQMEKRYLHKNGHFVWVRLSVSMVCDIDGATLYFVSQIEDISDRRPLQQAGSST